MEQLNALTAGKVQKHLEDVYNYQHLTLPFIMDVHGFYANMVESGTIPVFREDVAGQKGRVALAVSDFMTGAENREHRGYVYQVLNGVLELVNRGEISAGKLYPEVAELREEVQEEQAEAFAESISDTWERIDVVTDPILDRTMEVGKGITDNYLKVVVPVALLGLAGIGAYVYTLKKLPV